MNEDELTRKLNNKCKSYKGLINALGLLLGTLGLGIIGLDSLAIKYGVFRDVNPLFGSSNNVYRPMLFIASIGAIIGAGINYTKSVDRNTAVTVTGSHQSSRTH